jgi:hypothetical protein
MKLSSVAESVAEHLALPESERHRSSKQPQLTLAGYRMFWLGIVFTIVGLMIGIIGKKLTHNEVTTTLGIFITFASLLVSMYPFIAVLKPKPQSSEPTRPAIEPDRSTKFLPHDRPFQPVSSVTEHTTALLEMVERPENRRDTAEMEN